MPLRRLMPLVIAAILVAVPAAASAAPKPGKLIEKRVRSAAPNHRHVRETLVRVYDPLPAEAGRDAFPILGCASVPRPGPCRDKVNTPYAPLTATMTGEHGRLLLQRRRMNVRSPMWRLPLA